MFKFDILGCSRKHCPRFDVAKSIIEIIIKRKRLEKYTKLADLANVVLL